MKKIAIISLAVLLPLACTKEVQEPVQGEETRKEADIRQVTVTAGQEVVNTRTFFNKSNGQITWNTSESPMAIFDGSGKQTFSHAGTTDDGLHASFSGSADVNAATWTAVHPAANAAWEGGKVYVSVPCVQQARLNGGLLSDMNTTAALVTHDGDGNLDNFVMKNVGGLLKLTVAESNIKSITVSSINKEPLTGKAELSFDAAGNPVVTPVTCQYETFVTLIPHKTKMEGSFPAGDYFVSIFPVAMEGGLIIDMEKTDGKVASVRSSSVASVARSADLEFAGFDTVAKWYEPELSTLTLDFQPGWPFNESITSSSADGAVWAGEGEHVMTYTDDNSILFYLHCSNWATAKSSGNGMRFGMGAGDYLLLPAIQGKNLKKVVVRHSKADASQPAIMTRGGSTVLDGGAVKGNAEENGVDTWELSATAHNMQYRYQLTKGSLAFIGTLELTYAEKPSNKLVIDMKFYDEATDKALNPLVPVAPTPALDTWGTQQDFTSSSGTYTINDTDYQIEISGGRVKIARGADKRGLGLNGAKVKLPSIDGYYLTGIKAALGGQASNTTATDPEVTARNMHLSTTVDKANKVWTHAFAACTMSTLPSFEENLTVTVPNQDYYLMMEWGWCYLQYLTLVYTQVPSAPSSAPADAPALLLDGGETIL